MIALERREKKKKTLREPNKGTQKKVYCTEGKKKEHKGNETMRERDRDEAGEG